MGQDLVVGISLGLAIFAIVGETIADKFPPKNSQNGGEKML